MTTNHETVGDVLAEMRERKVNHGKHTSQTLVAWADRIERAHAAGADKAGKAMPANKRCGMCGFTGEEDPAIGCPRCGWDEMQDIPLLSAAPAPQPAPEADVLADNDPEGQFSAHGAHLDRSADWDITPAPDPALMALWRRGRFVTQMLADDAKALMRAVADAAPQPAPSDAPASPQAAQGETDTNSEREILQLIAERDRVESALDRVLDHVLGEDRAEWSSAYNYDDAVDDVEERMAAIEKGAAGSSQAAQGDVEALARKAGMLIDATAWQTDPDTREQADSLWVWAQDAAAILRSIASAQPATAKPAGDAEFKVGDRVEWTSDGSGDKFSGTLLGYHVAFDCGSFVDCALPSSLTRLTGGSHE